MFREPHRGIGGADVDRVARHVRRRVRRGYPSGSFLLRAVRGDGLAKQLLLVGRGAPAAVDDELDPGARGVSCCLAQGSEEIGVEVGHTRNLVIEDRRVVGDGTVSLAKATIVLTPQGDCAVRLAGRTTVLAAKGVDGWCLRRGR